MQKLVERGGIAAGDGLLAGDHAVIGEQPVLRPGDTYEYSSGCPLETPSGIMFGRYRMEAETGEAFDVAIPAFSLDTPGQVRTLN